jgi:hypothetical protein
MPCPSCLFGRRGLLKHSLISVSSVTISWSDLLWSGIKFGTSSLRTDNALTTGYSCCSHSDPSYQRCPPLNGVGRESRVAHVSCKLCVSLTSTASLNTLVCILNAASLRRTLQHLELKWRSDNTDTFFRPSCGFPRHKQAGTGIIKPRLRYSRPICILELCLILLRFRMPSVSLLSLRRVMTATWNSALIHWSIDHVLHNCMGLMQQNSDLSCI